MTSLHQCIWDHFWISILRSSETFFSWPFRCFPELLVIIGWAICHLGSLKLVLQLNHANMYLYLGNWNNSTHVWSPHVSKFLRRHSVITKVIHTVLQLDKIDHYYYKGQTARLSDPSGIGLTWLLVMLPDTTSSQPNLVSDWDVSIQYNAITTQ